MIRTDNKNEKLIIDSNITASCYYCMKYVQMFNTMHNLLSNLQPLPTRHNSHS